MEALKLCCVSIPWISLSEESGCEYHATEFSGYRALSEWILVAHFDEASVGNRWGGRWQASGGLG